MKIKREKSMLEGELAKLYLPKAKEKAEKKLRASIEKLRKEIQAEEEAAAAPAGPGHSLEQLYNDLKAHMVAELAGIDAMGKKMAVHTQTVLGIDQFNAALNKSKLSAVLRLITVDLRALLAKLR
jgi:predicted ribosome quality control (RQC) complex YloA/Tae2 family protein